MSDTLQLVVNVPFTQHHKNNSTFQARNECPICFSLSLTPNTQHHRNNSTFQVLNECPICFSLSSTCLSLNTTRTTQHSSAQRMSDTLQLVVNVPHTQHHRNNSTFQVRNECPIRFSLSLSCRITQTPRNCSSGCPICFSLSVTFPTLNSTGATQHSIGHSLRLSMVAFFLCGECPEPHRQAEAYRTFA